MTPLKVAPKTVDRLLRYKCTCGHCEDRPGQPPAHQPSREAVAIEGFQEWS
jgi:hypothetical protein